MGPYSNSRLSAFENCPKLFEFRYVLNVKTETESIESFVGKRVHEVLERLYHHVGRHGKPPSLRQMLDRFHKDWRLHWHDAVGIARPEFTLEYYQELGERCLENYYRSHYPFDAGETIAIEEVLQFQLDSAGRYPARGIVDRIVRTGSGAYEIHDYKTGSYLPPQKRLDSDRQLALYQIGLQQQRDDVESVELVWHYLAHNRTCRSRRTPEALDRLRAETISLIDRVEATSVYPAKPGPLCRWCEYRQMCPEALLPAPIEEPPPQESWTAPPVERLPAAAAPKPLSKRAEPPIPPGGEQLQLF